MASSSIQIATFDSDDIELGRHLGSGAFSSVYSFRQKKKNLSSQTMRVDAALCSCSLSLDDPTAHTESSISLSGSSHHSTLSSFAHDHDPSEEGEETASEWVLKKLQTKTFSGSREKVRSAILDMHNEAKILSSLPAHPNIINLKGVSSDFWTHPQSAFLVLEQLVEPLDQWLDKSRAATTRWNRNTATQQRVRVQTAALGTAEALAFLHRNHIVFRDLKPANIGLDKQGRIRLFDFALAKRLDMSGGVVRGRVGTLRWLAPEVALSEPYGDSADTYSFGLVLWQICTLEAPFRRIRDDFELSMKVMDKDDHPPLSRIALSSIKTLLADCWKGSPGKRPEMREVASRLQSEVHGDSGKAHRA